MQPNEVKIIISAANKAGAAFQELKNELNKLDATVKKTGDGTKDLSDAFKTLSVKSTAEIEKSRAAIEAAYNKIKNSGVSSAADIRQAWAAKNRQIAELDEQLAASNGSVTSLIKNNWLGITIALAGVVVAVKAVAAYVEDISKMAGTYDMLGVTMRVAGKNAGYSEEEMAGFERTLRETGIAAIEARQTITRMAASQMDLADSAKLARAAQDLAVVGGINSSEAFERVTYAIQSAQVEMLRTIGLNVSFEAGYKKTAAQLKKNVDQMSEQEKMQSRVNTVLAAAAQYYGIYEESMTSAQKQMGSMQRYLDDYKVAFGEAFQPAYLEIVKAKTEAYKDLTKTVSDPEFQESLRQLAGLFADIYRIVSRIPGALSDTLAFLRKYGGPIRELKRQLSFGSYEPVTPQPVMPLEFMSEETKARWKRDFEEFEKAQADIASIKQKKTTDQAAAPDDKAIKAAQKLAEEWVKVKAGLQLDLEKSGLNEYGQKLLEITQKAKDLRAVYGDKPIILKWEMEQSLDVLQQQVMKDDEEMLAAARKKEEVQKWLTDKIKGLTLSEFDYKRAKLLEEYEERAKVVGWTEQLYSTLKNDVLKIDDEEKEHKLKNLQQVRQAEIANQLALIDIQENNFQISREDANRQRIAWKEEELDLLQKQYDRLVGIAGKDLERQGVLQSIRGLQSDLVDLIQKQKELTGSLGEGLEEAAKRYSRSMETEFQKGDKIMTRTLDSMESGLGDFFDYASDGFGEFGKLATNILHEIYMELMKLLIIRPMVADLGNLLSGVPGLFSGSGMTSEMAGWDLFHQGGVVRRHGGGAVATKRYIPTFHAGGLNSDERMVINKVGERYITEEQNDWLNRIAATVKGGGSQSIQVGPFNSMADNKKMKEEIRRDMEDYFRRKIEEYS